LIQKIHDQDSAWVITPPKTGPSTVGRPVTEPNTPIGHSRQAGGNAALSRANASGITAAAPTVRWTARATMNVPAPGASAQTADATVNSSRPPVYTGLRPHRSPSVAALIIRTPVAVMDLLDEPLCAGQ
jgi:hypothetical protein